MFAAIRNAGAYTAAQRRAWCPAPPELRRILASQTVVVARGLRGPVGFASLRQCGYLDLAFVHPAAQGKGVLTRLFMRLRAEHDGPFSTHASVSGEPAFRALGFEVAARETVRRNGQRLRRSLMKTSA